MTDHPAPHSDDTDDTDALIDHALTHPLTSPIEQAQRRLPEAVSTARANPTNRHELAQLLGTSPDQARPRCDPDSPTTDRRWPPNH
jgi:hypothetical protein